MRSIFVILTLWLALFTWPVQAANCVAIVYEDDTIVTVPWTALASLRSTKRYLVINVQHVQDGTTRKVQFTGTAELVYIKSSRSGIVVGEIIASPNSATEFFFNNDGTQVFNQIKPTALYQAAGAGSEASFFTYPFAESDYNTKQNRALSADIGSC